ncbi:MAG: electron transport complex subunit RsxC [Candidatus Omnitrophica bacterium]|nr:electron transport complex subunit RsxC [Candidatus Omnitrophota bacterium]
MTLSTFPGGIHPPYDKEPTIKEPLREAPLPDIAVIPLIQHIGTPARAVVKKGDYVEESQIIGASAGFISSNVHSSVYGEVIDIKNAFHPSMGPVESIFVKRDKTKEKKHYVEIDIEKLSKEEMKEKIRFAGIVGMGGAGFPTHVKLSPPEGKRIKHLIINGAECEPYLTCDHILMTKKAHEIIRGIDIVIRILNPENVCIAIEDNKKAAHFAFKKVLKDVIPKSLRKIKLVSLRTKYPQGGEKQLIKAVSGLEVPPGGLPMDIGFLVQNVGTIYAIYEAVYFNKPLIERIVTITGDAMYRPGNFIVRVGSTLKDILDTYGLELFRDPEKIIFGGPMMGVAQPGLDAPVIKGSSGIVILSGKAVRSYSERQCIRCAKCVDVCPVNLLPTEIMKNSKKGFWEQTEALHATDCIECGACAYVCPSRIPLVQYIKTGKSRIAEKRQ